jgi:hypothetical protein
MWKIQAKFRSFLVPLASSRRIGSRWPSCDPASNGSFPASLRISPTPRLSGFTAHCKSIQSMVFKVKNEMSSSVSGSFGACVVSGLDSRTANENSVVRSNWRAGSGDARWWPRRWIHWILGRHAAHECGPYPRKVRVVGCRE